MRYVHGLLTAIIVAALQQATGETNKYFSFDPTRTAWNASNWATNTGGPYTSAWGAWDNAFFEGTAGAVTLGTNQSANSVTFEVSGYTLANNTLTLGDPSAYWPGYFAGDGCTGTVSSTLANSGAGNTIHIGKAGYGGQVKLSGNFGGLTANNRALVVETGALYLATATTSLGGGTGGIAVSNGATLVYDNSGIVAWGTTAATTLRGAGTFVKKGAGNLILGSGGQTVNVNFGAGALIDLQEGSIESSSSYRGLWTNNLADIRVASGATFKLKESKVYAGALIGGGIISQDYACGAPSLTVGREGRSGSFSGVIRDNGNVGSLEKLGAGTQTLSGANTYSGTTVVSGGELRLAGDRTVVAGAVTVGSNAVLNIQGDLPLGGHSLFVGTAAYPSGAVSQTAGTLSFTGGDALLIGNGANGSYVMSGGVLNCYASTTRGIMLGVNSGTASKPVVVSFTLSDDGYVDLPSSLLEIGRYDTIAHDTVASYVQTGGRASVGTLTLGGSSTGSQNVTASFTATGGFFTNGSFTVLAAGTNNTASMTIGGTADVTLPAFPSLRGTNSTASIMLDGGTLRPYAASTNYLPLAPRTTVSLTTNGAHFAVAAGKDITVYQVLQDAAGQAGRLAKSDTGVLTLAGANTYSGGTVLNDGSITAVHGSAFGTGSVTLRNTGADFNGLSLSGGITVTNDLVIDMAVGRNTIYSAGAGTNVFSGPISITNNFIGANIVVVNVNGGSALRLDHAIDGGGYTGTFSLRGTSAGRAGLLTSNAVVTLAAGATLDNNGTADWVIASTGSTWTVTALYSTGSLVLGADDALATAARVTWQPAASGDLDLAGFDQSVAGLDIVASSGTPAVTNSGAGDSTLTLSALASDYTYVGAILDGAIGKVGLVMNSAGRTQSLLGPNAYSGPTTVSAGTLILGTGVSPSSSVVTVADGATNGVRVLSSGGQSACGGLSYAAGGTQGLILDFGQYAPDANAAPLVVNGNLDLAGTLALHIRGGAIRNGTYPLIVYSGTRTGSLPAAPASLPLRTEATLNETNNTVYLNVVTAQPLTWQPGSGTWDTTTTNWADAHGGAAVFTNGTPGDSVLFDDSPTNAGPFEVTLSAGYTPASVAVDATNDYTLGGGGIGGSATALTKRNSGTLTLGVANGYAGGTWIEGGAVRVTNGASLGPAAVVNDGALIYDHSDARAVAAAISGTGMLVHRGAGTLTVSGSNSYGGVTLVAGGKLQAGANAALGSTATGTRVQGGPGALSLQGSVLELVGSRTVAGEALELTPAAGNDGTNLYYRVSLQVGATNTATWSGPITLSGGDNVAQLQAEGTLTVSGPIGGTLTNTEFWVRGSGTGTLAAAAIVTIGSTPLGKQDGGIWTLSSVGNAWGDTRVYNGTLSMGASNALPATTIAYVGTSPTAATLKMNGTDQTVAGLANSGAGTHRVTGGSAVRSVLTINAATNQSFTGILGGAGANENNLSLVKAGAGTQTLAGNNTMTGSVTVAQGMLLYSVNQTTPLAGVLFGAAPGSAATGGLDLTAANLTAALLLVRTSNTTANTIAIGAGKTLALTGSLTVGGDTTNMPSALSISGSGAASVTGGNVSVSRYSASEATLNMSGLSVFLYANTNGTFGVAALDDSKGTVTLAASNSITAATMDLGHGNGQDSTGVLNLGAQNTLRVNNIYVGTMKSLNSQINFSATGSGLDLAGATTQRANLYVGYNNNPGASTIGVNGSSVNWNGSTVTAMIGTLEVGYNNLAIGQGQGTLSFNQGSLDATSARVGHKQGATGGAATGTLNIGGGAVTFGSLRIATSAAGGSSIGTVNLAGGTTTLNGSIATSSNGVSTLALAGGTLDMTGKDIGDATNTLDVFTYSGGLLKNVGVVYGGIVMSGAARTFQQEVAGEIRGAISSPDSGLTKTGAGTLALTATNAYGGATDVQGGALNLSIPCLSASNDVRIATGATMGLSFDGTNDIRRLYLGGMLMPAGVYGSADTSALTGTGFLRAGEGAQVPTGTILTVR